MHYLIKADNNDSVLLEGPSGLDLEVILIDWMEPKTPKPSELKFDDFIEHLVAKEGFTRVSHYEFNCGEYYEF